MLPPSITLRSTVHSSLSFIIVLIPANTRYIPKTDDFLGWGWGSEPTREFWGSKIRGQLLPCGHVT